MNNNYRIKKDLDVKYRSFFEFVNKNVCSQENNGYYIIPSVQRQFIWKERLFETLVNKFIKDEISIEKGHDVKNIFLGYILLYSNKGNGPNSTRIIDGQQRLITFTLVLCTLRHLLLKVKEDLANPLENVNSEVLKDLFMKSKEFDLFFSKEVNYKHKNLVENISTFENINEFISFVLKWLNYFILLDDSNKTSLIINSKEKEWLEKIINYKVMDEFNRKTKKLKENTYINLVFNKILEKLKNEFDYDLNIRDNPHKIIKRIMYFMLAIAKAKFVVTKIENIVSFDSEYSMFINLNARRQNLAPYDIIKGFMLGKMDECNIDTLKINDRGRNLDERMFNLMFANYKDKKEMEIIKKIYYDIDDSYPFMDKNWKKFINDFKDLKKPYILGNVKEKNDILTDFFVMFHGYYTSIFRKKKTEELVDEWVEKPFSKTPSDSKSFMKRISFEIRKKSTSDRVLWNWYDDIDISSGRVITFEKEEEDNMVNLFYAYIRTFSKTYFHKIFGIENYIILEHLTKTPLFKPEILRIILSILDENLKLDKSKIEDASKALELIVWYYMMYFQDDVSPWPKRFVRASGVSNTIGINKFGFWQIDLKGYIKNLKREINDEENKSQVFDFLRRKRISGAKKIISTTYPFFLSQYSKYSSSMNKKEQFYLKKFIENDDLTIKLWNKDNNVLVVNLFSKDNKLGTSDEYQIGNYFLLQNEKKIPKNKIIQYEDGTKEIKPIIDDLVHVITSDIKYKEDESKATKEFISQIDKMFLEGEGIISWDLISQRTERIIEELDSWIKDICK